MVQRWREIVLDKDAEQQNSERDREKEKVRMRAREKGKEESIAGMGGSREKGPAA